MDPNQQTTQQGAEIVNQPVIPTPVSSSSPSGMGQEPKKSGFLLVFLILLFIAVVVAGGIYYFLVLNQTPTFTNQSTISPFPTRIPTPTLTDEQAIDSLDTGTVDGEVADIERDLQGL